MERSLTVLLPVQNAEATLAQSVHDLLEVVSELTRRFDLLIVDDGSSDATSEVAHELTRCYPQVRAVTHGRPLGREAAVRTGLRSARGDFLLLPDEDGLGIEEIRRLWRGSERPDAVAPRRDASHPGPTRTQPAHPARYCLLDRRVGRRAGESSRPSRPNFLARLKDLAMGE